MKKLDDVTDQDQNRGHAIKVSIPSIVMQMYAQQKYGPAQVYRFDKYTVTMTHPDARDRVALRIGRHRRHFTSPPFASARTQRSARFTPILTSDDVMGGSTTFTMVSTTTKFREQNPKVFGAVLKALRGSQPHDHRRQEDRGRDLAGVHEGEKGFSVSEIVEVLNDPHVKFTTTPENVMKYADFMHGVGSHQEPACFVEGSVLSRDSRCARKLMLPVREGVTLQYRTQRSFSNRHLSRQLSTFRNPIDLWFWVLRDAANRLCSKPSADTFVPIEGDILLDNMPVKAPAPDRVFVFQEFDQLLPWKTVKENIVFALTASGKLHAPSGRRARDAQYSESEAHGVCQ